MDLNSIIPPHAFYSYLGVVSVLAVGAMALDKGSAVLRMDRVRERNLALIAFAGGFAGIILGGVVFHHKTSRPGFWVPVATTTIVWGAILTYYLSPWTLRF